MKKRFIFSHLTLDDHTRWYTLIYVGGQFSPDNSTLYHMNKPTALQTPTSATLDNAQWVEILQIDSLNGFAIVRDDDGGEIEVSLNRLDNVE